MGRRQVRQINNNKMGDYTEDQLADFKEMFGLFDMGGEGKVSIAVVGNCIRAFGLDPTNAEVNKALGNPSKEDLGSKFVTFKEYNGSGLGAELRHVLLSSGEKMDAKDVDALMVGQEQGEEGTVDYAKFSAYLLEG